MRIVFDKIEIFIFNPNLNNLKKYPLPTILKKNAVFIKIYSNESLFGLGEPSQYYKDLKEQIKIIKKIYYHYFYKNDLKYFFSIRKKILLKAKNNPIYYPAVSSITQAYYDIKAKSVNKPLYKIINENKKKYNTRIPLYASGGMIFKNQDFDILIDEVLELKEIGFKGWKFRPKTPNSNPDHFFRALSPPSFNKKEIIKFSYKLRKVVGDDFLLMIDFGKRIKKFHDANEIISAFLNDSIRFD